ncbi:MAG: hypothetical protein ACK4ZM_05100 [bacterium]
MKVTLVVKSKDGNIIYSEEFLANQKSDLPNLSSSVANKMVELEKKYPYPDYEVEQLLSFFPSEEQDSQNPNH